MTSKFYARYVPPPAPSPAQGGPGEKRKRDDAGGSGTKGKKKKKKNGDQSPTTISPPPQSEAVPEKQRKKERRKEKPKPDPQAAPTNPEPEPAKESPPRQKHPSVFEKLRKVKEKISKQPLPNSTSTGGEPTPLIALQGLDPLPQPAATKTKTHLTLASALPPWLANPITVSPSATLPFSAIPGVSPRLQSRLQSLSLDAAFAVQSVVVPLLLDEGGGDVCISAATGSGKTLAYILPIFQVLEGRVVTRLRAVVVVPTRELVAQVSTVAGSVGAGTGIKVGTAVGSRALAAEQGLLVDGRDGSSKVDVLVTTPGRLVEHVQNTRGFTLQHVRWLVIDEADRLLAQSFQEWVDTVVGEFEKSGNERDEVKWILDDLGVRAKKGSDRVRKVVLSATMTRDAGKLAGLKLRRPQMVVVEAPAGPDLDDNPAGSDDDTPEEIFSVPAELKEIAVPILNTEYKPLYLMYILRDRGPGSGTLVFVKSNEAAARLASLVETFISQSPTSQPCKGWAVGLVTGEMERKRREKVLRAFRKGETHILICSDLISRGLDLPNVSHIINYDIPASTRAYVHRVGRTARAGNAGDAITLLADKEARWFWRNVGRGIKRGGAGVERGVVEMEEEGAGWRGVYEGILYGGVVELGATNKS